MTSGEPDALKGASPVRFHGRLQVQFLSPLLKQEKQPLNGKHSKAVFLAFTKFTPN